MKSSNLIIGKRVFIGENVKFFGKVNILDGCVIEDNSIIGYPSRNEYNNFLLAVRDRSKKIPNSVGDFVSNQTIIKQNTIIHQGVIIGSGTTIGENCEIYHYSRLGNEVIIGNESIIKDHCTIGDKNYIGKCFVCEENGQIGNCNKIGNLTKIFKRSLIYDACKIGDRVRLDGFVANRCQIGNDVSMLGHLIHKYKIPVGGIIEKSPIISDGATIGKLAAIIAADVGTGAYVGAGAVVTKDVNANRMVVGVPAKDIGKVG